MDASVRICLARLSQGSISLLLRPEMMSSEGGFRCRGSWNVDEEEAEEVEGSEVVEGVVAWREAKVSRGCAMLTRNSIMALVCCP